MYQCKNCNKFCKDSKSLRRHYLVHLPYYFGNFICINCEQKFDSEFLLLKHCFSARHRSKQERFLEVKDSRKTYFKLNNKWIDFSDIRYFINKRFNSNKDYFNIVENMESTMAINSNFHEENRMEDIASPAGEEPARNHLEEICSYTATRLTGGQPVVPDPPQLVFEPQGTPTMDERGQCSCSKLEELEKKMDRHILQMEQRIDRMSESLLSAMQRGMQYHQTLAQTYVNGQIQTQQLANQIRAYNLALCEASRKAFGEN